MLLKLFPVGQVLDPVVVCTCKPLSRLQLRLLTVIFDFQLIPVLVPDLLQLELEALAWLLIRYLSSPRYRVLVAVHRCILAIVLEHSARRRILLDVPITAATTNVLVRKVVGAL